MKSRRVTLINKLGLHARAAAKLVSLASGFTADIFLKRGSQEINAKSIMGILMLAAPKGTELEVCAQGRDADKALDAIIELINDRFGEAE